MKICLECKHCSYREPTGIKKIFPLLVDIPDRPAYSRCLHETALIKGSPDREYLVVGGDPVIDKNNYRYCNTMRSIDVKLYGKKYCGEDGIYWEPK
mgnify:CR=1 FL=1